MLKLIGLEGYEKKIRRYFPEGSSRELPSPERS